MIWDAAEPGKEGSGNTTAEVRLPAMMKSLFSLEDVLP